MDCMDGLGKRTIANTRMLTSFVITKISKIKKATKRIDQLELQVEDLL